MALRDLITSDRYQEKIGWLGIDNTNQRLGLGVPTPLAKIHAGPPWENAYGGMLLRSDPPTPGYAPLLVTTGEFANGTGGTYAEPNAATNIGWGLGEGNAPIGVHPGFGYALERCYGPPGGLAADMAFETFLHLNSGSGFDARPMAGVFNRTTAAGFWAFASDQFILRTRNSYALSTNWATFDSAAKSLAFTGGGVIHFGAYNLAALITAPNNFGTPANLLTYGYSAGTGLANTLTLGSGNIVYVPGPTRFAGDMLVEGAMSSPSGMAFNGRFYLELARVEHMPNTIVSGGTIAALGNADYVLECNPPDGTLVVPLPANPAQGRLIEITNVSANQMVVSRNGKKINGLTANLTIDPLTSVTLRYLANTATWFVTAAGAAQGFYVELTDEAVSLNFRNGVLTSAGGL
jgi:hypothetical protein